MQKMKKFKGRACPTRLFGKKCTGLTNSNCLCHKTGQVGAKDHDEMLLDERGALAVWRTQPYPTALDLQEFAVLCYRNGLKFEFKNPPTWNDMVVMIDVTKDTRKE